VGGDFVLYFVMIMIRNIFFVGGTNYIIIIIISLLMPPLLGTGLPHGLHVRKKGNIPPRGPSADWLVLTTKNAVGTNV
jgi:hypothetical protein